MGSDLWTGATGIADALQQSLKRIAPGPMVRTVVQPAQAGLRQASQAQVAFLPGCAAHRIGDPLPSPGPGPLHTLPHLKHRNATPPEAGIAYVFPHCGHADFSIICT